MQLSFSLALIAGLVSFLSPCVLPLVPAYIGYMGGRVTNTVAAQTSAGVVHVSLGSRISTVLHGLAFVAGFTLVFVTIGLLGTAFVNQIGRQNINVVTGIIGRGGGILIILFGLHFMGVLPSVFRYLLGHQNRLNSPAVTVFMGALIVVLLLWIFADLLFAAPLITVAVLALVLGGGLTSPGAFWTKAILLAQGLFYTDTRRQMVAQGHQSYLGSAAMGVIFSAGWTPCIGPIYGTILTMAATGGDVGTAGTLLLAYSLGLGIPFIATAFLLDGAQGILRHLTRHLHKIEVVSGVFLVIVGVLVASGRLQLLSQNFAAQFADFSYNLEECVVKLNKGEINLGGFVDCARTPPELGAPINTTTQTGADTTNAVTLPTAAAPALDDQTGALPSILELDAAAGDSSAEAREVGLEIGKLAPEFTTTTETGTPFSLANERGRFVLLSFWATWCGPCRVEMPEFQKAFVATPDLTIVGVNNAETAEQVAAFRDELNLTFPLVLDTDASVQKLYGINAYPSTYLLDREGVIVALHFGPLTAEQIAEMVQQSVA